MNLTKTVVQSYHFTRGRRDKMRIVPRREHFSQLLFVVKKEMGSTRTDNNLKIIFVHFDTNTALFRTTNILLDSGSLVSRKQYRPRTTDNDFNIQIFRHFLPD